jgi:hypothetical protein
MIKTKPVAFALIYSILVIAFKLFVFYSGLQMTKLGMYSHILSLLIILPFVFVLIFLLRKEKGGDLSGKDAVKYALIFVSVSAIILSVFNYVFFENELKAYIANYIQTQGPKSILEEAAKKGQKISQEEIDKMIKGGIEDLSAFKDTTSKLFSVFIFGVFSSFVSSIFLKRNTNE